ncbi:MAG: RluA family pseudouridine synthase [Lachnospiraceae bacterium]|nr:RluA family pseudouridine synthase [Lachnospiraceae bacterium]
MNRTLIYNIDEASQGLPIKNYLKKIGYSSQNLVELKKMPKSVLVNGSWVYLTNRLNAGDILTIQITETSSSENVVPIELPLHIIYEDEDLMVINKPAGMPIHPSLNNYENSLGNALAYYFASQNIPFVFRCINRLDRDTSGLTLIAKHMVSAGMLSSMIANKKDSGIKREYRALVRGQILPPCGTITAPIMRREDSILERIVDFAHGEEAITHYQVIEEKNGHSLISLLLETGRTHQIRVHMKHLGHPLIGDYLYNPDMDHINRQALHSYRLQFMHPITHKLMDFTAPLPADMLQVIQ